LPSSIAVYLEVAKRRVFAGALDWPGWCRSGRDEDGALDALVAYGRRYKAALGRTAHGFTLPADASALEVAERLEGDATTDFGAPGAAPASDQEPLDEAEAKRLAAILQACWRKFDGAGQAAVGSVLSKGPRGGGRELDAIVDHVRDAEGSYLSRVGGEYRKPRGAGPTEEMKGLRTAFLEAFRSRAAGEPPLRMRRSGSLWSPRYSVRRSAWHALDHAWEIEDRAMAPTNRG
jgi:hypothetical protein